jgi:tRNA threonylcarbamoyladenosine biosynthesis protein TsaE
MLRGLGYGGRVPSPTYTLLEQYLLAGLTIVHLDLYRLSGDEELENLGLRDWLAEANTWLLIEWPERAPQLAARCDLSIEFTDAGGQARSVAFHATTAAGIRALEQGCHGDFNNDP